MNPDDEIKKLEEKQEHLTDWINKYNKATNALPFVQKQLDITNWEIDALNARPDEASEIPFPGLASAFERENDFLKRVLPQMPEYDMQQLLYSTAASTGGTIDVYEYITRVGDLDTPAAIEYEKTYSNAYQELQAAQNRRQSVRDFVLKLRNPQTLDRFDKASKAYSASKIQAGERTFAAYAFRDFLNGVKGDLFNFARKWPNENMTWEIMAERLTNGSQSMGFQEIIRQKDKHSSLLSRLADIAKDRESGALTNIENVWVQVLDHVHTVLGLVNQTE